MSNNHYELKMINPEDYSILDDEGNSLAHHKHTYNTAAYQYNLMYQSSQVDLETSEQLNRTIEPSLQRIEELEREQ